MTNEPNGTIDEWCVLGRPKGYVERWRKKWITLFRFCPSEVKAREYAAVAEQHHGWHTVVCKREAQKATLLLLNG